MDKWTTGQLVKYRIRYGASPLRPCCPVHAAGRSHVVPCGRVSPVGTGECSSFRCAIDYIGHSTELVARSSWDALDSCPRYGSDAETGRSDCECDVILCNSIVMLCVRACVRERV